MDGFDLIWSFSKYTKTKGKDVYLSFIVINSNLTIPYILFIHYHKIKVEYQIWVLSIHLRLLFGLSFSMVYNNY